MRFNGLLLLTLVVFGFSPSYAFAKNNSVAFGGQGKESASSLASANHQSVGYDNARIDLLGGLALQQKNNGYVIVDVYCEVEYKAPGPGKIPNNSVLNVEHTWPQSKFGGAGKGLQKSDLHHLFPTDSQLNSIRGNNPFGIVEIADSLPKCGDKSKSGRNAQGSRVFEPPSAHKGNVARALFYFSVRYNMQIDQTQEEVLREWHVKDPVDDAEMARNDDIEEIQGNRNPFIDNPALAASIENF